VTMRLCRSSLYVLWLIHNKMVVLHCCRIFTLGRNSTGGNDRHSVESTRNSCRPDLWQSGKSFLQLRYMFQMCEEVDRCRTLVRPGSMPANANVSLKGMMTLSLRVESLSVAICAPQTYTTAA